MKTKAWFAKMVLICGVVSTTYAIPEIDICPNVKTIRAQGSNFHHAYSANNRWILVSDRFANEFYRWQTFYHTAMDTKKYPSDNALSTGNQLFKSIVLLLKPSFVIINDKIQCSYAPAGADYRVYTVTPIKVGKL